MPIIPTVLVVFSNPGDSDRLRLDREHRQLDEMVERTNSRDHIRLMQATTISDLAVSLSKLRPHIVHFSGHGSPNGIYLEKDSTSEQGVELSSTQLADLICTHCPHLHALVLMSCYSAASAPQLRTTAPYVVTVEAEAEDHAALMFSKYFYDAILTGRPIEAALTAAQLMLDSLHCESGLQIFVTRRADEEGKGRTILRGIKSRGFPETLLIDVTDIERQLDELGIRKGEFFAQIANKIYIHRWLMFESADMQNALLPIGKYLGVFSWKTGMDLIVCHRLLHPRDDASAEQCALWMGLAFDYNQLFAHGYRHERDRIYPGIEKRLESALREQQFVVETLAPDGVNARMLLDLIPDQAKLSLPLMRQHLGRAEIELAQERFGEAIAHLETVLSLLHGVVDGLSSVLSDC